MGVECLNIVSGHARSFQHIMVVKLLNSVALPSAHSSLVGSDFRLFSFFDSLVCFVLFILFFYRCSCPCLLSALTVAAAAAAVGGGGGGGDGAARMATTLTQKQQRVTGRRHTNEQWMKHIFLSIDLYFSSSMSIEEEKKPKSNFRNSSQNIQSSLRG